MGEKSAFLFHAGCFFIFASTVYHNIFNIYIKGVTDSYGGRFKFLTFINLLTSLLYYGVAFLADCIRLGLSPDPHVENDSVQAGTKDQKRNTGVCIHQCLAKFRDMLFATFIFPFGSIVTITFWAVMMVDSELMLPSHIRHMIPVHGLYNHSAHTFPMFLATLELYLVWHPYYPRKKSGITIFSTFALAYLSWILWIAFKANIWVYPFLKVLSWPGFCAFIGTTFLFGTAMFSIGFLVHSKIWDKKEQKVE